MTIIILSLIIVNKRSRPEKAAPRRRHLYVAIVLLSRPLGLSQPQQAPVTTLVVKDRVTDHNPVCVLYGQNFYYKRLQSVPVEVPQE